MKKLFCAVVILFAISAHALTITKAGPIGELATAAEANEVRVVFSEPMIVLGKIPNPLVVPWFHVSPELKGNLRWSGTTTLIFTPDPRVPLPFATKFDVTVDATAASVKGVKLGKPYQFSFVTPTIQLKSTDWMRKEKRFDAPVVIALRFNQPVDGQNILQHLQLRSKQHEIKIPPIADPDAAKRIDPSALTAYEAKAAKATAAAASDGAPVFVSLATAWDKTRFRPSPELVVLETKPGVSPDTNLVVLLDGELASANGKVRSGKEQAYTIELEPTLFIDRVDCMQKCNPDHYIPIVGRLRGGFEFGEFKKAVTLVDVTDPKHPATLRAAEKKVDEYRQIDNSYSLDELGYSITPAHTYEVRIAPTLQSVDGQKLGYTWVATIEYWHESAFTSFGDGHGVWESSGGPLLPFHARNYRTVKQWLAPLTIDQIIPTMVELEKASFQKAPNTAPVDRKLAPVADKIQSYGLDISPAAGPRNHGLAWAAIQEGEVIEHAEGYGEHEIRSTLVQVTGLGVSVKDSPQNTLVFVSKLDDATPVAKASVAIRSIDNRVVWSGLTDEHGIAVAPNTDLRRKKKAADSTEESDDSWEALGSLHFIVSAEKDGDVAYAASNWNNGIEPWEFGLGFDLSQANSLLRGSVFSDRGVYKLGEQVHLKTILRADTPTGMQLLPAGTKVTVALRDSHDKEVDKRDVTLNEWSSAEWTVMIPAEAPLGTWSLSAQAQGHDLAVGGELLVAAYRRPEFRVDATLTGPSSVAGVKLDGKVEGRYLFGGAMSGRPVKWTYTKSPLNDIPARVRDRFSDERWSFLGDDRTTNDSTTTISTKEQKLTKDGVLKVSLDTDLDAGRPWSYQIEGDVTDVSRQHIAGRASFRVDPAPWYVGVKTPPYFSDSSNGLDTELVAAALDGTAAAGVKINVELHRIQWNSVRQSEGNGFYNWESERKEVPAGSWSVTTQAQPVPLHVDIKDGGEYVLIAKASDAEGRSTTTRTWFYAVGSGYTAWERSDNNRIELIPEKKTYKPGDVARIMVKSPWEKATAVLTTEREGVRTWKEFALTSTQQTITIPITEKDIPNVFVSVLLVKGRTKDGIEDESDPGKPAFRLGYVELYVDDLSKRLKVDVKANHEEYRPATKARIEVDVRDFANKGTQSEVTLWAVDYGVLSLTDYKTPQIIDSVYLNKMLQVVTEDSRQKLISRRVLTPKGETQGGGGGRDSGPGMLRKDFRVLAFWVGSITTDRNGHAKTEITLPESLTTYRIMAVAADKASRFGAGQNEIRISKPVLVSAAFPRFMAVGDKATFGGVIHSQLKQGGMATVTIHSLDPSILELHTNDASMHVQVDAGAAVEVKAEAEAKAVGTARIQISVTLNGETDSFEDVLPVRLLASTETVAAYGEASPSAEETLKVPSGVIPGVGGLHFELASTSMVGLGEGARYLVDYPYGCAEQRSSAAFALMLASDLGDAFSLPGIDARNTRAVAQKTLYELPKFQCGDGGFAYWAGECGSESPYLTSTVLHVMQRGQSLKYDIDKDVMNRAYQYLEQSLKAKKPENEGWWPAYTSWQAFALKVLTEGGHNEDSSMNRIYSYVDRMPIFGISWLADAMKARGETGKRVEDLNRRINNAILPEAGSAHVEELNDPYLSWYWSSNVRSTAIALDTLVRQGQDEQVSKQIVRWLMQVRKGGRWGNTQENAWAMEALVDYYRKYESTVPDFTGVVTVGTQSIAKDAFHGRSTEAKSHDVSMETLLKNKSDAELPVKFERQGSGTLFYLMRLKYAQNVVLHDALDQGFKVERIYPSKTFKAGEVVKITLRIRNTKERRFVAVTDPIPAGTEPVDSWFATTATDLADAVSRQDAGSDDWMSWWRKGGFDHVERHDDRVTLFATRLGEGVHEFSYLVRATTTGTFLAAPTHVEEMYEPEVFGRTATAVVDVK